MKSLLILLAFALAAITAQAADLYRWVDANGKVHYSDQLPPQAAKDVEKKKFGGNLVPGENLPYGTRQAMKNFPVTLYGGACGEPCDSGRQLLNKRGIPFADVNPAATKEELEAFKKLSGGVSVPVLKVGDSLSKGFESGAWNSLLDAAGYPKSNPLAAPAKNPPPKAEAPGKKPSSGPAPAPENK